MSLYVIEGGLSDSNSAQIPLEIKNSARIYNSRKAFALDFIRKNRVTLANFSKHRDYAGLTKNEKDAIRYYLRKKLRTKTPTRRLKSRGAKPISKLSAVLLSFPVLLSEFMVLSFSYVFYMQMGFSRVDAIICAACLEAFYLLLSGINKNVFKLLRIPVFLYSVFTVCYSTYISDPKVVALKSAGNERIESLREQLKTEQSVIAGLLRDQAGIAKDMEIYRKNELVTKGRARVAREKSHIAQGLKESKERMGSLSAQIATLKTSSANAGVFTWSNLKVVEVRSWALIAFLVLIQLLSSICLTEIFKPRGKSYGRLRLA